MTDNNKKIEVGKCQTVEVSKIKASKFNARHDQEAIDSDDFVELCNSIREDGLIEPIVIRKSPGDDGKYEAIAGSRRLRALKHVGVHEAPTIIRYMDDNDVRIASLVENIHRKGLSDEEKEQQLKDIYAGEGWKDLDLVKKMLHHVKSENVRTTKKFTRGPYETEGGRTVDDNFRRLVKRIGYAPGYQYQILGGEPERAYEDTNFLSQLSDFKRELIEKQKELEDANLQQIIASEILHKSEPKAEEIVGEYVHAIREGEFYKDEENIWRWKPKPKKTRKRRGRPKVDTSALKARRAIMKNGTKLFELITGMPLDMNNVKYAEQQAKSKYAQDHMIEICNQKLAPRELRVFQDIMIPLHLAIGKLIDEIENVEQ